MAKRVKAALLQQSDDIAIRCIDCSRSCNPIGWPVVIDCLFLKRKLVGESKRRCKYFNLK